MTKESSLWRINKMNEMFSKNRLSEIDEVFLLFWIKNYKEELRNYVK